MSRRLINNSRGQNYGALAAVGEEDVADEVAEAVEQHPPTASQIRRHFNQTLSMSVAGYSRVPSDAASREHTTNQIVNNTMPQRRSPRLVWLYKDVVTPSMPHRALATEDQFNCCFSLLSTNHPHEFFRLFDNCQNGAITTEELVNGFRKVLQGAPGEDRCREELSAILFNQCQSGEGMKLEDFKTLLDEADFKNCFTNIFKEGENILRNEFCEAMERLAITTNDEKYLMYLVIQIKQKTNSGGEITKATFKDILGTDKRVGDVIVDRLFAIYGNGTKMNRENFITLLTQFILGSDERKVNFLFTLWDHDNDGVLDRDDIKKTLETAISESKVTFSTITTNDLIYHFIKAVHHIRRPKKFTSIMEYPNTIAEEDENAAEEAGPSTRAPQDIEVGLDTTMTMPQSISDSQGNSKPISRTEFRRSLLEHPDLLRNLTFGGKHLDSVKITNNGYEKQPRSIGLYIRTHIVIISFTVFLFLVNAALAVETAIRWLKTESTYRMFHNNVWFITARIGGQLLNFNSALIFLTVCRHWITFMRATPLAHVLPFDYHIEIHKWLGIWIFFLSCMHGVAHLINVYWTKYYIKTNFINDTVAECLFTTKCKIGSGWVEYSAVITGWALLVILIIMIAATHPKVRQKGYFEVFFGIHHLFIVYVILCILHGPVFYIWFIVPGIIYVIERILRMDVVKKLRYGRRSMKLLKAELLPSNVAMLKMARPADWIYKPGDYIFIKIREISQTEYHPFTISSAPEIPGYITLHIQALGNWTRKLQEILKEAQIALRRPSPDYILRKTGKKAGLTMRAPHASLAERLSTLALSRGMSSRSVIGSAAPQDSEPEVSYAPLENQEQEKPIEIFVDGPYGTPSRHIFQAEHAVLVCTGVGVTPFSSILQSVYHQYSQFKHQCPNCNHVYYQDPYRTFKMKKVDFYWVNRNHDCFEWFTDILRDLEKAFEKEESGNQDPFLDINFFHTGALQPRVVNKVALNLALDFVYETHEMDLLSGLRRARVTPGRPNWAQELDRIEQNKRGKLTVFYCGNPHMAAVLKKECHRRGINFRQEVF